VDDYQVSTYTRDERPPDIEPVERFVIRPQDPWFSAAEQDVVRRSLRQQLGGLFDSWTVIRRGGLPVATIWFCLSDDSHRTGILGYALTDPAHRGKGLARRACQTAVDTARRWGSKLMFLGTGNPVAARVYQRVGFAPWYGATMCLPERGYQSCPVHYGDARTVRRVRWSDFGALVRFIIDPQPQTVIDHFERLTRQDGFLAQHRTASTAAALLLRAEKRMNAMLVLANDGGHIQGLASILISPEDAGRHYLQLTVHPNCQEAGKALAADAVACARESGIDSLLAITGADDFATIHGLTSCGFKRTEMPQEESQGPRATFVRS